MGVIILFYQAKSDFIYCKNRYEISHRLGNFLLIHLLRELSCYGVMVDCFQPVAGFASIGNIEEAMLFAKY